jgi:hypothetical protein
MTTKTLIPTLIKRDCGGWLATAHVKGGFTIGVTGPSEPEARTAFAKALRRWQDCLSRD